MSDKPKPCHKIKLTCRICSEKPGKGGYCGYCAKLAGISKDGTATCVVCGHEEYVTALVRDGVKWYCPGCEPKEVVPCSHHNRRPVDYLEGGEVKYGAVCLDCGKGLKAQSRIITV